MTLQRLNPTAMLHLASCCVLTLLCAMLLAARPMPAQAEPLTARASTVSELYELLSQANGGETILLDGRLFGKLELNSKSGFDIAFPSNVTIVSADRAHPAVFSGLVLNGAANVTFDGLMFDYVFAPGNPVHSSPFRIERSRGIVIRNSVFDGDFARNVSAVADGYGWGRALIVESSSGIVIADNEISNFHRGIVMGSVSEAIVRGNELYALRSDGMDFVKVQGLLVEGNYIHDFRTAPNSGDHPDMIQFWTRGSDAPSTDVTIRGNILSSGAGAFTQSIFMRNDMVDRGRAGREMFYRNILIEENVIINGHAHGITVGATLGLTIRHNTLIRNQNAARGADRGRSLRVPRINLAESSLDVVVEYNMSASPPSPRPGWVVQGNLDIQDRSPMRPGYYRSVFRDALGGDPSRLDSFAYLPSGPGGSPSGPGSALLRMGLN